MGEKRLKQLSHTLWECKYHVVFCPKYRHRVLGGEAGAFVERNIYHLWSQKDQVTVLECNVQPDQVHLVVAIPPKYSVSEIMGFLKGKLALKVFGQYPQFRKQYWGQHFWSRGYCVSSVGIDEEEVRRYVKWQEKEEKEEEEKQRKLF